ncbi:metallophosphoesterase [Thermosyntropha sp.]|uniref:metallophosphoesterase n=1 Tax=Thermosyntropha sp. TaxID=2740820 RepID=UPI0025FE4502|nr:metallophosphoesterase [Thermosyntropha sp.]MBO8159836.1 metallophosphoesterase [Thermosyntropha sp.]
MSRFKKIDFTKIAVLGDTHSDIEKAEKVFIEEGVEYFLFTGDYYSDAVKLSKKLNIGFTGVIGNCDLAFQSAIGFPEEEFLLIGDKKVYMVHGHQYRVKENLNVLYYRALEVEADVVIFGHTHIPVCEEINQIWFLNPGSPTKPRNKNCGTWGLIYKESDNLKIKLLYL